MLTIHWSERPPYGWPPLSSTVMHLVDRALSISNLPSARKRLILLLLCLIASPIAYFWMWTALIVVIPCLFAGFIFLLWPEASLVLRCKALILVLGVLLLVQALHVAVICANDQARAFMTRGTMFGFCVVFAMQLMSGFAVLLVLGWLIPKLKQNA